MIHKSSPPGGDAKVGAGMGAGTDGVLDTAIVGVLGPGRRDSHDNPQSRPVRPRYAAATSMPRAPSSRTIGRATLVRGDCLVWLRARPSCSVHAVVTDPPYGHREYCPADHDKLRAGRGGVWRIPPSLDGRPRRPVPRFTTLTQDEQAAMAEFFGLWAAELARVLVPGGHVIVATQPLVSHVVYAPLLTAGLEKRGEIIRLVQTLRGGDRPKGAESEFADVSAMPRAAWEPWGLFRKPCEGTVADNLRRWKTGGLRRVSMDKPFTDVIPCAPTHRDERALADHPSLKPQRFLRQIVRAALPLGEGVVLDPMMGSGSTLAAAESLGYESIGIERDPAYYRLALEAVPRLAAYAPSPTNPGRRQRTRER